MDTAAKRLAEHIGVKIAECRLLHGWSRDELAKAAGLTVGAVRAIEAGDSPTIRIDEIAGLLTAMGSYMSCYVISTMAVTAPAVEDATDGC